MSIRNYRCVSESDFGSRSGDAQWPIVLPVSKPDAQPISYYYTPKSDFFLSLHNIPRVIAEVRSIGPDDDCARMLLQGASLVRLVNELSEKRSFVLMAFYFDNCMAFDRYLLYQKEKTGRADDDKKVRD